MANKKKETCTKPKVVPTTTLLEEAQKIEVDQKTNSSSKVAVATPEPAVVEKIEKGKKAQAAKKGSKGQQMLVKEPVKDQSEALSEIKSPEPSEAKENDGEAKDKKVKEAKTKKQVAVEPVAPEPIAAETTPVSKKGAPEQASEKATKMKRLTLDIAKPLHKAIKAKAVEEGVPMVDMLRSLLEEHYSK